MRKLLIICGPTAIGKTRLAVYLSELFNGQIISADSRQVYKYMDIGTGKERPEEVNILGYDLVGPNEEFSVKKYADFAYKAIKDTYKQRLQGHGPYKEGKLPILVGGTGLYISAVVDNRTRIYIPRNLKLRRELAYKSADELFAILMKKNSAYASGLNESDRKNPRRLIRALEIVSSNKLGSLDKELVKFDSVLWIGLMADIKEIKKRIDKRVEERVESGFEKEIEFLKRKGYWDGVAKTTLGYKDWPDIEKWKMEEYKYAKRQMTWFKKEKRINWFDITKSDWQEKVEELVKKWYSLGKN